MSPTTDYDDRVLAAAVIALIGRYAARARQGPTASVQRSAHDELRRVVQMSEEVGNTVRAYLRWQKLR
jgi:hypothetical protein